MGLLLDTHALYWLVSGVRQLSDEALVEIGVNQGSGGLLVSPITGWEISVAAQKPSSRAPDLGGLSPSAWFREAIRLIGARLVPIRSRIALEAAAVATVYARRDPGDCFLIATARVRRVAILTRDAEMIALSQADPDYLRVVEC